MPPILPLALFEAILIARPSTPCIFCHGGWVIFMMVQWSAWQIVTDKNHWVWFTLKGIQWWIWIYMDYGNWMVMVDISDPEIDAIFSSRKQCQLRRSWNFDFSPPGRTAWIPSGEANNTKKSYILITKKPKGNAFTKLIYFMARIISNRMNDFKSSCKPRIRTMRDPMIAFQDFQGIIGCVGEALRVQVRHQAKTWTWAAGFQWISGDVSSEFSIIFLSDSWVLRTSSQVLQFKIIVFIHDFAMLCSHLIVKLRMFSCSSPFQFSPHPLNHPKKSRNKHTVQRELCRSVQDHQNWNHEFPAIIFASFSTTKPVRYFRHVESYWYNWYTLRFFMVFPNGSSMSRMIRMCIWNAQR